MDPDTERQHHHITEKLRHKWKSCFHHISGVKETPAEIWSEKYFKYQSKSKQVHVYLNVFLWGLSDFKG